MLTIRQYQHYNQRMHIQIHKFKIIILYLVGGTFIIQIIPIYIILLQFHFLMLHQHQGLIISNYQHNNLLHMVDMDIIIHQVYIIFQIQEHINLR